jgi:hypothetical protein
MPLASRLWIVDGAGCRFALVLLDLAMLGLALVLTVGAYLYVYGLKRLP